MKNKRIYLFLTLLLIAVFITVFCACNNNDTEYISAYEIAVKNGFNGTEEEWLKQLHTTNTVEKTPITYNTSVDSAHDVSVAANIGLKSAVSIYCTHTIITNSWFGQSQTKQAQSAGSGVIYSLEDNGSAYIITNHHVVYENSNNTSNHISDDIKVFLYGMEGNGYAIPATYVGGSLNYDIAVLRIENSVVLKKSIDARTVAAVEIADSNNVRPGQLSIAIGNPEAEGISVTSGIVSVDSEYIDMTAVDNRTKISLRVIRTDTAVNSGNSGGGLFDDTGRLIGIVNAKSGEENVENIAYAIPSNVARAIADNIIYYSPLMNKQCVMRVLLNVTVQTSGLSTTLSEEDGFINKIEQVTIASIMDGSIVNDKLEIGDIINSITIGDKTTQITRQYMFIDALLDARVGSDVKIGYTRNGQQETATITITQDCLAEY